MEKKQIKNALSRLELDLHGFFWVYYGPKEASRVSKNWDLGLPMIRESVKDEKMSREKLVIFGDAIKMLLKYAELKAQYKAL